MKIQKNVVFFSGGGGGGGGGDRVGVREGGWVGGGFRADVNGEVKFL